MKQVCLERYASFEKINITEDIEVQVVFLFITESKNRRAAS